MRLWDRICRVPRDLERSHKYLRDFGRGFRRIHENLGDFGTGFAMICGSLGEDS